MSDKIRSFAIIGCGGHARDVADVLLMNKTEWDFCFIDDNAKHNETIFDYPCLQQLASQNNYIGFITGIGDNITRCKKFNDYKNVLSPLSVIARNAWIGNGAMVGKGVFIGSGAHVGTLSCIGDNTIINTQSNVSHEVQIGSHTHIAVGAVIAGKSKVGSFVMVGANATVIDNVTVCDHVTIGAGAVVVKDIMEPGTYVGVPARKILS